MVAAAALPFLVVSCAPHVKVKLRLVSDNSIPLRFAFASEVVVLVTFEYNTATAFTGGLHMCGVMCPTSTLMTRPMQLTGAETTAF
jgi:hypothetical protein